MHIYFWMIFNISVASEELRLQAEREEAETKDRERKEAEERRRLENEVRIMVSVIGALKVF